MIRPIAPLLAELDGCVGSACTLTTEDRVMNTALPTTLAIAGKCPTCGQTRCASPRCFRAALRRHEAPPVLSRQAANKLIVGLMAVGWPRARATERIDETFTIIA